MPTLSNSEIADRLLGLAQLLSAAKDNPYKVRAYQRTAAKLRSMSESVSDLVESEADLTQYASIGDAMSSAIREIVHTGQLNKLEKLRSEAKPEIAGLTAYPRLDPKRVIRIYKKLKIDSVEALNDKLENGEIEKALGLRMAQHVRQGLTESSILLLNRADDLHSAVEDFLLKRCRVTRAQVVGDVRRRVEVIEELAFLIETDDFPRTVAQLQRYGGRTPLLESGPDTALFAMPSGIRLRIHCADAADWGSAMIACTGSQAHLRKLFEITGNLKSIAERSESSLYARFGLQFIEPELREGYDEVERARAGTLPELATIEDLRGELHAHSTASDGSHSIEQMAAAARARGYEYLGITDHSQSLKIARGLSVDDLWEQIRLIDRLNASSGGFRILKSAEVDILADGSLDYPDELLDELDYTVCSIHSRFGLGREAQTERILRAMDNRNFNILGHATGRLLLMRPGYEIDIDRMIAHARAANCFFEINSSPNRLDLSAENARKAAEAGVKIAVSTDAHSVREYGLAQYGMDQARRAGLSKQQILNCQSWPTLERLFHR